ncbi:hypothetical protein F4805DRAFT_455738 [Annulohypoxylon moriforme]|nr:hypothetical protein F4805DRAFT_455738 [Annulohypoxylon moriforme]
MDYLHDFHPSGRLPYPNLIDIYARIKQEDYFMEPKTTTRESGSDDLKVVDTWKRIGPRTEFDDGNFGTLSHVYCPRRPGEEYEEYVFFRRDRGPVDHGLSRKDEDLYECSKFNILRRPQENGDNNPNYGAASLGGLRIFDRVMLGLANYPHMNGTVMSAPLLPRCRPNLGPQCGENAPIAGQFSIRMHEQHRLLAKVFRTPELCLAILKHLGHRWGDLSNLSRTCQLVLFAINKVTTHLDMRTGNFLNMQYPNEFIDKVNELASPALKSSGSFLRPKAAYFAIISNIKGPYLEAPNGENEPQENGYPAAPTGNYGRPLFKDNIVKTYSLLKMVQVRGPQLSVLHLHSVPNIDISVLKMCLKSLPNLQVLGVYNCEPLGFEATVPFLNMVISHNANPDHTTLLSDFSPYYYPGIQRKSDGRRGEYGVTASDIGTIDTRRAVTAVLRIAVDLALDNGIDWFSPGTGMRQFLERLPWALGSLRYILEALFNLHYFERGLYHVVYKESYRKKLEGISSAEYIPYQVRMLGTLHNDLVLAVHGKAMKREHLDDIVMTSETVMSETKVHLLRCSSCGVQLPRFFFSEHPSPQQMDLLGCDGCNLCHYLRTQIDNFSYEKKQSLIDHFYDSSTEDLDTFFSKQVIPKEDLQDLYYTFWQDSAKSPKKIQAASIASGTPLILDEHPSSTKPDEMKEIWLGIARVARMSSTYYELVDRGQEEIEGRIDFMNRIIRRLDEYYSKGLANGYSILEYRASKEQLLFDIEEERARQGIAQRRGLWGVSAAAEWDTEISRYRQNIQTLGGELRRIDLYDTAKNKAHT